MRGDQPERRLVSPIVIHGCIAASYQSCVKVSGDVPSRPYRSSRRTTSSRCGVETSMTSVSSSAVTRCTVRGRKRNALAGDDLDRLELASHLAELERARAPPARARTRP